MKSQAKPVVIKATHRPVSIDYRGNRATVRPTFTSRTVKPPHMRGHRKWLELGR